jgi:hypothetical protein
VGCGYGRWGNLIRSNFWESRLPAPPRVDGIDAFAPNVEFCSRQGCYGRVWHHRLPEPLEGQWDTVLACEIIEHVPQSDVDRAFAVLEGAARRRIIISTPNFPDFRPGGGTITGVNDYEAHLSYVSRDEFILRGYKIIGAGFGIPDSEFTNAILKVNPGLLDILQSLSRAFPSMATSVVAFKDMDSATAPLSGQSRSISGLSLHDLRIATVRGRCLAYDPARRMFVCSDGIGPATVMFVMKGDRQAFAVSAAYGMFTFMSLPVVHCRTEVLNIWEILDIGETITSYHGSSLDTYCDLPDGGEIALAPPPLAVVTQTWFGELLRVIDPLSQNVLG